MQLSTYFYKLILKDIKVEMKEIIFFKLRQKTINIQDCDCGNIITIFCKLF